MLGFRTMCRLELLRKLVPHAERANTACFLEEVIKYIEALKARTLDLESQVEALTGKPVPKSLALPTGMPSVLAGGSTSADNTNASPRMVGAATSSQGGPAGSLPSGQPGAGGAGAGSLASPSTTPPPTMTAQQASQQLSLMQSGGQAGGSQGLPSQLTLPSGGAGAGLLSAAQQSLLGFPQSGGLSLSGAGLSLGGSGLGHGTSGISLTQFAGNLQAAAAAAAAASHGAGSQSHSQSQSQHSGLSLGSHHVTASQLNELQAMQMMQSLQQHHNQHAAAAAVVAAAGGGGGSRPGSTFHPTNNKAFLHFNEDAYAFSGKPELSLPARSLLGAAAASAATPSTSLQLTTVQLPADSNTLLQVNVGSCAAHGCRGLATVGV